MDFNQLMSKMRELDAPTNVPAVEACGDPMGMPPGATSPSMNQSTQQPPSHPSMTVNLNAHGMSDIESMMRLFQKVNPDMMPKDPAPMPSMSAPPSIMSIAPDAGPTPINKLLPDLSDEPSEPSGTNLPPEHDKDHDLVKTLDRDGDGDHDMDDHDMEKDDEEDKQEAYVNEPNETEFDIDKVIFGGTDLHKEKKTYPKVAGGDNPMQKMESGDLRAQIRAELLHRLAEAKSK